MTVAEPYDLGKISTPDGQVGQWSLSSFSISPQEAMIANFNKPNIFWVRAGEYRKLCRDKTVVMSNTPMEIKTNRVVLRKCGKRNLINGLGMGMALEAMLRVPHVEYVRVIEYSKDVIELVGKTFANDPRVEIIHADAFKYSPAKGEKFDFVWHDIWDYITSDNLTEMATLGRKYGKRCGGNQEFWAKDLCKDLRGTMY